MIRSRHTARVCRTGHLAQRTQQVDPWHRTGYKLDKWLHYHAKDLVIWEAASTTGFHFPTAMRLSPRQPRPALGEVSRNFVVHLLGDFMGGSESLFCVELSFCSSRFCSALSANRLGPFRSAPRREKATPTECGLTRVRAACGRSPVRLRCRLRESRRPRRPDDAPGAGRRGG